MQRKPEESRDSSPPSEFELIERVQERLGEQSGLEIGPGDDAAVVEFGGRVVVSVDSMVEGVHFPSGWPNPEDVVHRALAGALSDLAAMAAEPRTVLVALGIPGGSSADFLERLADATVEAADLFGVSLAGGDVVEAPALFISVTVMGELPGDRAPATRSGARPGDLVAVTGDLGGSAAGLALISGTAPPDLPEDHRLSLTARYLRPTPLTSLGVAFGMIGPSAMVDVSDGLVADLGHLADRSGVSIRLDADSVPLAPGVEAVARATGRDALGIALSGGEDYELALTADPGDIGPLESAATTLGIRFTVIGEVGEGSGVEVLRSGRPVDVPSGFEHSFRADPGEDRRQG